MPWIKVDDSFTDHPKLAAVGPLGIALQIAGLCYANRNQTDGFIPKTVAQRLLLWELSNPATGDQWQIALVSTDDSPMSMGHDVDSDTIIPCLVHNEVWDVVRGGYQIHNYLDWQRSSEEIAELSTIRAEAGRRGGKQKASKLLDVSQTDRRAQVLDNGRAQVLANKQNASKTLAEQDKEQDKDKETSLRSVSNVREADRFGELWPKYPKNGGTKQVALKSWLKLSDAEKDRIDVTLPGWLAFFDSLESPRFVPHMATWLNQRRFDDDAPVPLSPMRSNGNGHRDKRVSLAAMVRAELGETEHEIVETTGVIR